MSATLTRSLGLSAGLHLTAAAIVLIMAIHRTAEPIVPPPFSFVIASPGSRPELSETRTGASDGPTIKLPTPPVTPPQTAVNDNPPDPEPSPPPVTRPADHPRAQAISYADFVHQNHLAATPIGARPRSAPLHHIPAAEFAPSASGTTANSSGESTGLRFVPELLQDLQLAFASPGLHIAGLHVGVEFRLGASGRLEDVRIVQSSGAPDFDAAALAAFRSVRAHDYERAEIGRRFTVTFRATAGPD